MGKEEALEEKSAPIRAQIKEIDTIQNKARMVY